MKYDYAMEYLEKVRNNLKSAIKKWPKDSLLKGWKERLKSVNSAIEVLRKEGARDRKKKRGGCDNPH